MRMPVTKADKRMSHNHNILTIKLEKKKASDHNTAARQATNPRSKAFHKAHAKAHKKVIKARQKYDKKIAKARIK